MKKQESQVVKTDLATLLMILPRKMATSLSRITSIASMKMRKWIITEMGKLMTMKMKK